MVKNKNEINHLRNKVLYLKQLGPRAQLEHGGGGRDEETFVAGEAQHQGQHAGHSAKADQSEASS